MESSCDHKGENIIVFFADPRKKDVIQIDGGKDNHIVQYCNSCGKLLREDLPHWIPKNYSQIEKHGK